MKGKIWRGRRTASGLGGIIAFFGHLGCKPKVPFERSETAYVIGADNILPLKSGSEGTGSPGILDRVQRSSVLVATKLGSSRVKFCSGTVVEGEAPGLLPRVLTNHHCFASSDAEGKATPEILPEACKSTKVYFGFTIDAEPPKITERACQEGSLRTSFDGDVAVLTLTETLPDGAMPMAFYRGDDLGVGHDAVIVHHPDIDANLRVPPRGGPGLPTAAFTTDDCKVVGLFDESDWSLERTLKHGIKHTCDLIHGSSGSGLVDRATATLIGVNWGGIKITEGKDLRVDNVATRADFAEAFLAGRLEEYLKQGPKARPRLVASAGASAEKTKGAEEKRKAEKDLVAAITGKGCGVVAIDGGDPKDPSTVPLAGAPLSLVLLLVPVSVVAWGRSPRRTLSAPERCEEAPLPLC